jgi:signal transduction histidine kinase
MDTHILLKSINELLPSTFVAIELNDPKQGKEFSFVSDLSASTEEVEEIVKKQMPRTENDGALVFKQTGNLSFSVMPFSSRVGSEGVNLGSLIVGRPSRFTSDEEFLLIVIHQHLLSLAKTHQAASEVDLRSQFLSIASHELKTPLTSIYGMLQLQERMVRMKPNDADLNDPEKRISYLKRVLRQVERMNELIDGLLDVSRIQNGRFMVEPSDNDVAHVLREAVSVRIEQIAREAGVTLHVDSPEHLVAWVDPVRLEEMITNLVMNAIRFSPEGGVVWIRLTEEHESFRLKVRDQGPSVPMEDRERIFRPFERAQRTARLGGMGLGLFISRQIAQLHNGNVLLVESVPGKGNVFEAEFPLRNTTQASA